MVFSAAVIRGDRPVGFRGVILDITERKRMEDALVQTNETLQALIKASPLAVVSFDTEGRSASGTRRPSGSSGGAKPRRKGRFNPIVGQEQKQEFLDLLDRVLQGES